MALALVALALDYYRDPLAFRHLGEARRPLPAGFESLFAEFCAALAPKRIAETAAQFGVEQAELEEAARFLVRHVLLTPEGDHYRCLGLNRGASPEAVRRHYQLLIRMFHPDRSVASNDFWDFLATRINLAYQTLRDPDERNAYDRSLAEYASEETTLAWLFAAQRPIAKLYLAADEHAGRFVGRSDVRLRLLAVIGLLAIGGLTLYLLSSTHKKPALQLASRGDSEVQAPVPSYLSHPLPRATTSVPEDAPAPSGKKIPALDVAPTPEPLRQALPRSVGPAGSMVEPRAPILVSKEAGAERQSEKRVGATSVACDTGAHAAEAAPTAAGHCVRGVFQTASEAPLEMQFDSPPLVQQAIGPKANTPPKDEPKPVPIRKRAAESDRSVETVALPASKAPRVEWERLAVDKTSPAAKTAGIRPHPASTVPSFESTRSAPAGKTSLIEHRPEPERKTPATTPVREAQAIIDRLQSAYRDQNADAFVSLFTPQARINEGQGRALIRSLYADLFRESAAVRLRISHIDWRERSDGNLSGSGAVKVSNKYRGSSAWEHARGRIDFVVIRDAGRYRIASMYYRMQ